MSSIRTVQPAHHKGGPPGTPAGAGLADSKANYEGASRYETRLRLEGYVHGRADGRREAADRAAKMVKAMSLIGGRKSTAERIKRECS